MSGACEVQGVNMTECKLSKSTKEQTKQNHTWRNRETFSLNQHTNPYTVYIHYSVFINTFCSGVRMPSD